MAQKRKVGKKVIRKLGKVGGGRSYSVALPVEVIRKFKWKERQKLTVTVDLKNKKLIIRDWKK
jgi:predicted Ser/Thr protein kinase